MQTNPPSDVSSRKKREPAPNVSFARDIRPLFALSIFRHAAARRKLDDLYFYVEAGQR